MFLFSFNSGMFFKLFVYRRPTAFYIRNHNIKPALLQYMLSLLCRSSLQYANSKLVTN